MALQGTSLKPQTSQRTRRAIDFFGLAFGSLFLLVGLFVISIGVRNGLKQLSTSSWRDIEGTVLEKRLTGRAEEHNDFSPVSYSYFIDGAPYHSDRVLYTNLRNLENNQWMQLANGIPDSGRVTVFVNPDNKVQRGVSPQEGLPERVLGWCRRWRRIRRGCRGVDVNVVDDGHGDPAVDGSPGIQVGR